MRPEKGGLAGASRRHLIQAALGVVLYLAAAPLLAIVHQTVVFSVARLTSGLAWAVSSAGLIRSLPLDPIYTSAMLLTLGGIEIRGIAVAGPLGGLLERLCSSLFEPPDLVASGAWASAVVEPGATVLSRWISGFAADSALLAVGILTVRRGLRGATWLFAFGAVLQAHVVFNHLIETAPELGDLEAAGIPFAVSMLSSGNVLAGPRLAERLAALPEPTRDALIGAVAVGLAYLVAMLLLFSPRVATRAGSALRDLGSLLRAHRVPARHPPRRLTTWFRVPSAHRLVPRAAIASLAVGISISPLGSFALAQANYLGTPDALQGEATLELAPPLVETALPSALPPTRPVSAGSEPTSVTPPTLVSVSGAQYQYTYTVNGKPTIIRGIGYNVRYRGLDPGERARRLDQDFAAIRRAGINTVFGWAPNEFDAALLDAAQAHGLGVAPPFDLSPDEDYADPAVRNRIKAEALRWVERYRNHPAIRMWAIGNEVLHKLVYPSWMPIRSSPEWEARARAFAQFLVELVDEVHMADPNHPIVHRDAEDAYLSWLREAMADGRKRPWFIYGVNSYTPRLAEILAAWPGQGFDVALLVSEFAPGGLSPADRPEGFRSMWRTIRAAQGRVIGGVVYAWTTSGPEEVDRVFGLVDRDGKPVDGSFATIAALFHGVERGELRRSDNQSPPVEARIWSLARDAIVTLQDGRGKDLLPPSAASSVMGNLSDIPKEAVSDRDLEITKVRDAQRVAWQQAAGISGEWWVTWRPAGEPYHKVTFLIQERAGRALQVGYIYHGPR